MYFTILVDYSKKFYFVSSLRRIDSFFDNRNINKADKYSSVYELKQKTTYESRGYRTCR